MGYTAKIENANGEALTLTGKEAIYQVLDISGLNPPTAQINTSTIVGLDGAVFNSAKLETRELVIQIRINGDVESNRLALYKYFKTKEPCTFYYSNSHLDVSIDGYVSAIECGLFEQSEIAQISILCTFPYFAALEQIIVDSSGVNPLFTFPFSIDEDAPVVISSLTNYDAIVATNPAESETGCEIIIDVYDTVTKLELENEATAETMTLNYSFQAGDRITINTAKGKKSIKLTRSGVTTSIFSALQSGSKFIQLVSGANVIEYKVNNLQGGNEVYIEMRYHALYRGV